MGFFYGLCLLGCLIQWGNHHQTSIGQKINFEATLAVAQKKKMMLQAKNNLRVSDLKKTNRGGVRERYKRAGRQKTKTGDVCWTSIISITQAVTKKRCIKWQRSRTNRNTLRLYSLTQETHRTTERLFEADVTPGQKVVRWSKEKRATLCWCANKNYVLDLM